MQPSTSDLLAEFRDGGEKSAAGEPSVVRSPSSNSRLIIETLDGSVHALPYAAVMYVHFDASDGIVLAFGEWAFELRGTNLRPLFEGLLSQTVRRIRAADMFDKATAGTTVVDSIKVEMKTARQIVERFASR